VLETVVIDDRFNGPAGSANGGYACAMAARWVDGPGEVTLRVPPPLVGDVGMILLGRLAADLKRPVTAGEPHVVQAWPVARDGRKLNTASALFAAAGDLCAVARAVWIEVPPKR